METMGALDALWRDLTIRPNPTAGKAPRPVGLIALKAERVALDKVAMQPRNKALRAVYAPISRGKG
jgi:hypothetical protein